MPPRPEAREAPVRLAHEFFAPVSLSTRFMLCVTSESAFNPGIPPPSSPTPAAVPPTPASAPPSIFLRLWFSGIGPPAMSMYRESCPLPGLPLGPALGVTDLEPPPPAGGHGLIQTERIPLLVGDDEALDHLRLLDRRPVVSQVHVPALAGLHHVVVARLLHLLRGDPVTLEVHYRLAVHLDHRGPPEDLLLLLVGLGDVTTPGHLDPITLLD